jgi:hypothetical protein
MNLAAYLLLLLSSLSVFAIAAETDSSALSPQQDGGTTIGGAALANAGGNDISHAVKKKREQRAQPSRNNTLRGVARQQDFGASHLIQYAMGGGSSVAAGSLHDRAAVSYKKVIECLKTAHFAKKVDMSKWRLPADAEDHYRDLLNVTRMLR